MGDGVEYLIITYGDYVGEFEQLAEWKTKKGVPTEVMDVSSIYSNYSGRDTAEQVRNCIIDYYQNKGTLYVLLGGEPSRVPYRIAYATSSDNGHDLGCDPSAQVGTRLTPVQHAGAGVGLQTATLEQAVEHR